MDTQADALCIACGQPEGTGTLLDFQPVIPPAGVEKGLKQSDWDAFASRFKCPLCAGNLTPDDVRRTT